ncbi:secretin and TonB N-terminal domain-containing protein [Candidatus Marinimicrobia bacterium]|nr:secretin and TonB N-terminal domain-containing protein [Candidatus Neomarinimicrobiota bacterium]
MNLKKIFSPLIIFGLINFSSAQNLKEVEDNTLITIHAEDAFLPSILAILAKESGYNIVTDPNVNKQDKVSIHLDEVPIEQAINLVVRAVGLSYEVVGNSFLVADPKKLKEEVGVTTYVVTLKYAAAEDVKSLLQDISDQVQVDIPGNKLLVHASPKKIAEIIQVVEQVDVPAIQIMLETRLIEVAADIEDKTGLDWSKISSYTTVLAENGVPLTTGGGSVIPDDQTIGNLPATMPFNRLSGLLEKDKTGIVPKYFSRQLTAFDLTLDMLLRNNKAEVLADSRLTTINGREASIKLVDIVPYILSSGGVGGQVQVQKEEVGIKLNIAPTVNTDGYITVKVEPEVSTIFEFIGPDANIPRVKSRTSSTTIRVKDGESIVIGGLLSNDKKQTTYKLPFFHRLPWLGEKLFTSRSIIERKTDLIIQITPRIIVDEYSGIVKSEEMIKYEKYVTKNSSIKDYNETQDLDSGQSEVE